MPHTYSYDSEKAVKYARVWALMRNPLFADYSSNRGGGGDCTNFISQCLFAGGWPMAYTDLYTAAFSWWARPPSRDNSHSWASVAHFIAFLKLSHRASNCKFDELAPGDLITHVTESHGGHIMFVTGIEDNLARWPLLCYHSTDRLDYSFDKVINNPAEGGSGFGPDGYKYWKLKDSYHLVAAFPTTGLLLGELR